MSVIHLKITGTYQTETRVRDIVAAVREAIGDKGKVEFMHAVHGAGEPRTQEERLRRIEARLGLDDPPDGWVTREKCDQLRSIGFSTQEAKQILINGYGIIPAKYAYFTEIGNDVESD